ncbi:serine threonine kinase [Pyrenophora seminiperda CCB06]|uniref:mitogen-activated protein kinase kinase n=1 Tax=Pyrenophora seminiperda CCB06 TaxID=1302712 RepID=A0A3M7MHP9_9PLEO|nr:serine threonine kinase [Pyrenophora seminiperda CCB06]
MAGLPPFIFPLSGEGTTGSDSTATHSTAKRQHPQLHLQTQNASREGDSSASHRRQSAGTRFTPPASPTRNRASTVGAQHFQTMQNSGMITPPRTPSVSHAKSGSASSDLLNSLSTLRRGDSISSTHRPRLSVDETPRPGSTELIAFPYHLTDYEICTDERGRRETIGEGAWSDVYLAKPCPPKSTETPRDREMSPPLTPLNTIESAKGLSMIPATPSLYAVKVPAMTSAKKVLSAEARILSYLSRYPNAQDHIIHFYGLDTRTGSLLLQAMDDTLEGWIQKQLNSLDAASRADKLAAVFPSIALSLITSLQWMQDKACTHADIKPSNMLVSYTATTTTTTAPKILYTDFSSTLLTRPDAAASIESEASPLGAGTWDYLDPCLLTSSYAMPSAASDLWSLAITLLFLVLGSSPYDAFKGNKFQQREMIKSGAPLQCMGYDDQGITNVRRVQALSKALGCDLMKWFGRVLVKDVGKRVGVEAWKEELEGAVARAKMV